MVLSKQKLKEIGESLHHARVEKNLTLEAVAAKTLISKRVLIAIEQGNSEELPEAFYTKALIAKYARAMGIPEILDNKDLVEEEQPTTPNTKTVKTRQGLPTFQLQSSHLYFIYLILVVVAVTAIAKFVEKPIVVDNPAIPEQKAPLDKVPTKDESTPTTISSASPSQFVSQSNSNNSELVVVDITLKDRCWLKVMVDGKVEFEGTLPKGTQRSWTGKEQINIIAGNAGGVIITYNHGQEKLLGKPGQVEEVTYTVN